MRVKIIEKKKSILVKIIAACCCHCFLTPGELKLLSCSRNLWQPSLPWQPPPPHAVRHCSHGHSVKWGNFKFLGCARVLCCKSLVSFTSPQCWLAKSISDTRLADVAAKLIQNTVFGWLFFLLSSLKVTKNCHTTSTLSDTCRFLVFFSFRDKTQWVRNCGHSQIYF